MSNTVKTALKEVNANISDANSVMSDDEYREFLEEVVAEAESRLEALNGD